MCQLEALFGANWFESWDSLGWLSFVFGIGLCFGYFLKTKRDEAPFLQDSPDAVLKVDPQGKILQANDAFQKLTGLNPSDSVGCELFKSQSFFCFAPIDLKIEQVLSTPFSHRKAKIIGPDQKTKFVSFSSFKKDNNWIFVFRDITEDYLKEKSLAEKHLILEERLMRDELTGCLNRTFLRHFLDHDNLKWLKNDNYSLIMIDIDRFKMINDQKGHQTGDQVLRDFGKLLNQFFRKTDRVVRYGGDEFCILLPQTENKTAAKIAERFRQTLDKEKYLPITVSMGVSTLNSSDQVENWFDRADRALYQVKERGRDGVFSAENIKEFP